MFGRRRLSLLVGTGKDPGPSGQFCVKMLSGTLASQGLNSRSAWRAKIPFRTSEATVKAF